jgi:hypothetical protein
MYHFIYLKRAFIPKFKDFNFRPLGCGGIASDSTTARGKILDLSCGGIASDSTTGEGLKNKILDRWSYVLDFKGNNMKREITFVRKNILCFSTPPLWWNR